jgi:hypothetical protein
MSFCSKNQPHDSILSQKGNLYVDIIISMKFTDKQTDHRDYLYK